MVIIIIIIIIIRKITTTTIIIIINDQMGLNTNNVLNILLNSWLRFETV